MQALDEIATHARAASEQAALANYIDASRSGGMADNRTQAMNVVISLTTTIAVITALRLNWVLGIFGIWAVLAGLLQLATAVRRWQHLGAQWAMILSGGQSALAGAFFSFCGPARHCNLRLSEWQAMRPSAPSTFSCLRYGFQSARCAARVFERLDTSAHPIPASHGIRTSAR
jgi:hypothetical protein